MLPLNWVNDSGCATDQNKSLDFGWVLERGMKAHASSHAVTQINRWTARVD